MARKFFSEAGHKVKDKTARKTVFGKLSVSNRGFAFLVPENKGEDEEDIYISSGNLNSALNGDVVEAALVKAVTPGRSREGVVVRIVEHANKVIVGTFAASNKFGFVVPDDPKLKQDIFISGDDINGAITGAKVVVEITEWAMAGRQPAGKIIEVLGKAGEPGVDILSIMRQHGLNEEFPDEVQDEADSTEKEINPAEHTDRKDRRNLRIVTVDGEDAKDLDDGVYAEKREDGSFFLGVYIADVSHYVREGSALDEEAYARGTSVYLVDRVCPMLPRELSNGICSLNAGVDRLAMACEMEISPEGQVTKYEIFPTIIHVYRRLSYTIVNKILVERDKTFIEDHADILPMLETLGELRNAMKGYRHRRGAIDFDIPEIKVKMGTDGKPVALVKREGSLGESIIEQCMLAANETVAEHICRKKLPFMYRIHQTPDEEKITKLNQLLGAFGLFLKKNREGTIEPRDLQKILEKVKGKPEDRIVSTVSLRSMQQARYSEQCLGHFGLAAKYYTHFTSPIRRYPDLIVHRLLRETFATGTIPEDRQEKLKKWLPEAAEQTSQRERAAVDAERETTDLKKVEYMAQFVGEEFDGVISSVTGFGMFVELDNGVEGLVHISSLADDYYEYVEEKYSLVGRHDQFSYRLGDPIVVVLTKANIEEKTLDFVVKGNGLTAGMKAERLDFGGKKARGKRAARRGEKAEKAEKPKRKVRKPEPIKDSELIVEIGGVKKKLGKKETGFEKFMKADSGKSRKGKKGKGKTKVKSGGRKHHGKDNRKSKAKR